MGWAGGWACLVNFGLDLSDLTSLSLDWEQHATTLGRGTRAGSDRSLGLDRGLQWELFITLGAASVDACSFTYL